MAKPVRDSALLCSEAAPGDAEALHQLGLAYFREGALERACEQLDRALNVAPDRADIWEHRGLLAVLRGDRIAAEAFYHRALNISGGSASVHRNLADCLKLSARFTEARQHYQTALHFEPALHHAVRALAQICTEQEQHADAANYWLRAWALDSANIADAFMLIAALSKAQRDAEIGDLLPALRARCNSDAAALQQLAFALNGAHRFADAISVARQGIGVEPHNAWLHHNASFALNMLGDVEQMQMHTAEAARLMPADPSMQFNLAAAQLRTGNFERGWKQYRWHDALPENHDLVRPDFPEWHGERVLGCRFLLIGEQGLGDQIQFLGMADWLHRRGAQVDVWVEEPLGDVARHAAGVHAAWTTAPPGPYDYWCRMLSVPAHMNLELSMLPLATAYLQAKPAEVQRWRDRLEVFGPVKAQGPFTKRVGIVWAGNPAYALDRYRSTALQQWRPLLEQPGVRWFSLQKGDARHDAAALPKGADMHVLGPQIHSFLDTLAIIQSLDLVVTVDTAVAHLAGACGTPVWALVPTFTDWRWMVERADSPWYPSMRLFRQRELNQWDAVLADVAQALQEYVGR
ncbi:glycosyltransferase family 9 protein [Paraburkholderia kirstenboschensis]|uniref:Glycosyltransferase family 9 protein n=1 Tax=Paraburkholderia kirstenboschensis TaxID=1245436 RepID=A0ABZ0ENZ6_9BURK|nr:glycosyltransferase family 9 protein [Paraburkholderia kirstenboschensis]WOD18897.1 glycosyltransferase family 9 protein [Paraburkholderia kirstenboschensis]